MSKKPYDWKRFWCPRAGTLNLDDGGYLYDPDAELGSVYNPGLVSLEAAADVPCLVLLGEPGIGKTHELEKLKDFTDSKISDPRQILSLNLRSCTNLKEDLFKDQTFINWLDSSYRLFLFLDSLDEGLLSIPALATCLVDEFNKPKYKNHIARLHLRLACRSFVFPASLEEGLRDLWRETKLAIYELAPLRRTDIIKAAEIEGLSPSDFLKEIGQREIVPLAIKPITLRYLIHLYSRHNRQFPPGKKLHDLYLDGCRELCSEPKNEERHPLRPVSNLLPQQRLIVSARIAAATIFSNRFAVWSGTKIDIPDEDIFLDDLCYGNESGSDISFEITDKVIKEVLDTGLFSSRGLHRMGWAHQTYAELLAAWYLLQQKIPLAKIMELICSSEDQDHKLIPQLYETAAWLAGMNREVLHEVINTDPNVLLQSDVPTDATVRSSIVDKLLMQYEEGNLFDRGMNNYRHYAKLNHPGLAEQLRPYICDFSRKADARVLAIDIAEVCKVCKLQNELAELALDSSQSIYLRVSAASVICSIGSNAATKLRLKPLAIEQLLEDKDDHLKGYALTAIWPDHLTVEELFQTLTRPKKILCSGSYYRFLNHELVPQLRSEYLVVALDWLKDQGLRCSGHPFEELGNTLLIKAWENFDLPGIAESFTQVALIQWKEYQKIIIDNKQREEQLADSLLHDINKRHALIEHAVLALLGTRDDLSPITSFLTENILFSEDMVWMLGKLQSSNCIEAQKIWAQLILRSYDSENANQIDAIIVATQTNNVLQETFSPRFVPIDLDSSQANELRTNHFKNQERHLKRTNPALLEDLPPRERVLKLLEKINSGDLDAWWRLNREMTLTPESKHYGTVFELDLTKLPGWQEADNASRRLIIDTAKKYVQEQKNVTYDWIGTNTYDLSALAGCRAFLLLLKESLDFLHDLPPEVWKRWAPVIIAANRNQNQREASYLDLVKYAYRKAPEEIIKALITLIDQENKEDGDSCVINRLDKAWDEQLKLAMLEKAKDPFLKPNCIGKLLEELLKQGLTEAEDFAKSLITFPLQSTGDERGKALIAARVLVENSTSSSWPYIWRVIQQDPSYGREVLELVSIRYRRGMFQLNLTEVQLADLYLWLVHEYPYHEDPDHSNESMEYTLTTRHSIARLRDDILSQLVERGTLEACTEIQRLIQALPDIEWLGKTLINAKMNMRRMTWQPMAPKELLRFLIRKEPSNFDISNQIKTIEERTAKMENTPNTDQRINVINSDMRGARIIVSGSNNKKMKTLIQKKGFDWKYWLGLVVTVGGILIPVVASGVFNEEIKKLFFNRNDSHKVNSKLER